MRIVFIGNVLFSKFALNKLISMKENIIAVFTKKESKFNADNVDLSPLCEENNIPYYYVKNINDPQIVTKIKELSPDVIYCFGFSQIIKKDILKIPPLGVIGFHPASLPANRGRHPIVWALFLGLPTTSSTFFVMDEGADSGDIISQVSVPIYYEDTAYTLYLRISECACEQIENFTKLLKENRLPRIKQNHTFANYWRKRTEIDGQIDFRMCSRAIYNLVRALTKPYVGAHLLYKGKKIKIWKVQEEIVSLPNIEPGKILEVDKLSNTILVKCYDNAIRIIEHEFDSLPSVGEYFI